MTNKIDVRKINRPKLHERLEFGDQVAIQKRLASKGIEVSDKTIRNAYDPRYPIGHKIVHVLKETVAFLSEKHESYHVQAAPELAEELQAGEG